MADQDDRDALAEVLAAHWMAGMAASGAAHEWECICGAPVDMDEDAHIAHSAAAVLASDWLAQRDRRVAAEAWDEGYEAGRDDELYNQRGLSTDSDAHDYPHANPYRADRIEAGDQ